jgi:hypothetical protein
MGWSPSARHRGVLIGRRQLTGFVMTGAKSHTMASASANTPRTMSPSLTDKLAGHLLPEALPKKHSRTAMALPIEFLS